MRLVEIYGRCRENYDEIYSWYEQMRQMYEEYKEVKEISRIQAEEQLYDDIKVFRNKAYDKLGDLECLQFSFYEINDAIERKLATEQKLNRCFGLILQMQCIMALYKSMGGEPDIGLDIKIPETDNITEFKKYIDNLEFIFTKCPFFQSEEASLKLETVDKGSIWLVIGVVCASATVGSALMNNIAAFIDKCFVIKSHRLTCIAQEQDIKASEYSEKEKEEMLEVVKKLYRIRVSNAIKELEESTGCHIKDGDDRGRAEQSLEKLGKLIDKGMQIYSSIDSPDEVKALFEPLEMKYLSIADELKKIAENSDEEDKE